jgi:hypothetical protein
MFIPTEDLCLVIQLNSVLQSTNSVGVAITDRTCLIMDEVDGMSAGDRGGVGALNALIKKSKVSFSFSKPYFVALILQKSDSDHLYCQRSRSTEAQASYVDDLQFEFPQVSFNNKSKIVC